MNRRDLLLILGAAWAVRLVPDVRASDLHPVRLVFVHGRSQQGKDEAKLRTEWLDALKNGAAKLGRSVPTNLDVAFPFYGNTLDNYKKQLNIPLTADIQSKGATPDDDFLRFQAEIAESLRQPAGITDSQVNEFYGSNPRPKGPQNWEWVQAIIRSIDQYGGGISVSAIENFMRDVYLYTTRMGIRDEIDRIVAKEINTEPTVVVGHSLGSVVAYNVLRTDRRALQVRDFVTLGSPLGIRAIRRQLVPLRHPIPGTTWYNAYDDRDVVALYPLDGSNFPVKPAIKNFAGVKNHTSNRHGISGYLDDTMVAGRILDALNS